MKIHDYILIALFLFITGHIHADSSSNILLMPLERGQLFTYERTDSNGISWENTWEIQEKIIINGDEYFRVFDCNYYPDDGCSEMYFLSSAELVYQWLNEEKHVIFLGDFVSINWSHSLGEGFIETRTIDRIEEVTVPYGGPFSALVHHTQEREGNTIYNSWEEYVVPGIGVVQYVDTIDPDLPAPLQLPVTTKLISIIPREACGSLENPFPDGDFNKDCQVDLQDFLFVANNWLVGID